MMQLYYNRTNDGLYLVNTRTDYVECIFFSFGWFPAIMFNGRSSSIIKDHTNTFELIEEWKD